MKTNKQAYFKKKAAIINRKIYKNNLATLNFGNGSVIDSKREKIFIKASGIYTNNCSVSDIVEVKIKDFNLSNFKKLRPSVDTEIHILLYKYMKNINYIVHSHSEYATILSQSNIEPECLGTTHADFFNGKIPLSEKINKVSKNYERQIANSIIKKLEKIKNYCPGILLRDHGVFAWGKTELEAINNLIAIEFICKLYFKTKTLSQKKSLSKPLTKFHYLRKNGKFKYYGQN
tara:strand:- start:3835 stop:4530 length:696 start_codon:yes stop_codon:yes gene_type:complete